MYALKVRISSKDGYPVGSLWIIDAIHMPYGCSVSLGTRRYTFADLTFYDYRYGQVCGLVDIHGHKTEKSTLLRV